MPKSRYIPNRRPAWISYAAVAAIPLVAVIVAAIFFFSSDSEPSSGTAFSPPAGRPTNQAAPTTSPWPIQKDMKTASTTFDISTPGSDIMTIQQMVVSSHSPDELKAALLRQVGQIAATWCELNNPKPPTEEEINTYQQRMAAILAAWPNDGSSRPTLEEMIQSYAARGYCYPVNFVELVPNQFSDGLDHLDVPTRAGELSGSVSTQKISTTYRSSSVKTFGADGVYLGFTDTFQPLLVGYSVLNPTASGQDWFCSSVQMHGLFWSVTCQYRPSANSGKYTLKYGDKLPDVVVSVTAP